MKFEEAIKRLNENKEEMVIVDTERKVKLFKDGVVLRYQYINGYSSNTSGVVSVFGTWWRREWEIFEETDDWDWHNCTELVGKWSQESRIAIEKLKAKILEDINKEVDENYGKTITGIKYIFDILDKRFGF